MILKKKEFRIDGIPAVLYGENSEKIYIFVHGRYSRKEEAHFFAETAAESGYQVLSFDLPEHGEREGSQYKCTAVNGVHDLGIIYSFIRERYRSISLYACSLGAFFSLTAYRNIILDNCLFVSPILDMERIIRTMMQWADVSEDELKDKGEIETSFGEKLSWDYYQYVRNNPVEKWNTTNPYTVRGKRQPDRKMCT